MEISEKIRPARKMITLWMWMGGEKLCNLFKREQENSAAPKQTMICMQKKSGFVMIWYLNSSPLYSILTTTRQILPQFFSLLFNNLLRVPIFILLIKKCIVCAKLSTWSASWLRRILVVAFESKDIWSVNVFVMDELCMQTQPRKFINLFQKKKQAGSNTATKKFYLESQIFTKPVRFKCLQRRTNIRIASSTFYHYHCGTCLDEKRFFFLLSLVVVVFVVIE